jgi:hypothetical protein
LKEVHAKTHPAERKIYGLTDDENS